MPGRQGEVRRAEVIARVNDPRNQPHFDMLGISLTVSATVTILALIEHELPEHELVTLLDLRRENLEIVEFAIDDNSPAALSAQEIDIVKKVSDDVGAVRNILADLAERDVGLTHERTGMFAKTVIENMGESTQMRSEPDQQAAFRVLKTAQFPSVLIELAYVTNREDAKNLNSDDWREKVAQSISAAIDNYFSHEIARLPM